MEKGDGWRVYDGDRARMFYDIITHNGNYFHHCFPVNLPTGFKKDNDIVIFNPNIAKIRPSKCTGKCTCSRDDQRYECVV